MKEAGEKEGERARGEGGVGAIVNSRGEDSWKEADGQRQGSS